MKIQICASTYFTIRVECQKLIFYCTIPTRVKRLQVNENIQIFITNFKKKKNYKVQNNNFNTNYDTKMYRNDLKNV